VEGCDPGSLLRGRSQLQLLKCLGRTDASRPIASIVPVTDLELEYGLHKDRASQFFSHNEFFSVTERAVSQLGKEHIVLSAAFEGAIDSVREAQRARNKMLSVSPTGLSTFGSFSEEDPLPKSFVRCAAQVRWAIVPGLPASQRFDVNEGMVYSLQLITARRNEAPEVNDLFERLAVRMGDAASRRH